MNRRTVITGIGHFVPPRVVTNFDLEKLMDTSDEWIRQRSGIVERHHVEPGRRAAADLAYEAAVRAIADAKIEPGDIDFIIAATLSPDHYFPGIGVIVQAKLGLETVGALDVRNQCCGFIYALSVGRPVHPGRHLQEDPPRRLRSPVHQPRLFRRGPGHGRPVRRRRRRRHPRAQ